MIKIFGKISKFKKALSKMIKGKIAVERRIAKMPVVYAGVPKNSGVYPTGEKVLDVAFWNEFGTAKIPSRPFLREGARHQGLKWRKLAKRLTQKVIAGKIAKEQMAALVGERMRDDIRKSLDTGPWEPNAEPYRTQKAKKGKTKPLIVTGQLRQSIIYRVGDNK